MIKYNLKAVALSCLMSGVCVAAIAMESGASQPLNSEQMKSIKKRYEQCVFTKGLKVFKKYGLRDALEFAPLACRKELLQAKQFMLEGAFKIEVIDQLVDSIEEGVKIDLANSLIENI